MTASNRAAGASFAAAVLLSACASNPAKIETAYVSPIKYQSYSCEQLAAERAAIEYRADVLYRTLNKRAETDALAMGAGMLLFLPTLLLVKGNGAKTAEFARLKGEYHALRANAESRGCNIEFRELYKTAAAEPVGAELAVGSRIAEPAAR